MSSETAAPSSDVAADLAGICDQLLGIAADLAALVDRIGGGSNADD